MSSNPNQATVKELNSLIHLNYDAIDTYEAAIKRVTDGPMRACLLEFRDDHVQHTEKLAEWVSKLGGKPVSGGDLKRVLGKGKVAMGSLSENMGILKAIHSNEETIRQRYAHALDIITEPAGLVAALEHQHVDEHRHTTWIDNQLDQTDQKPYPFTIAPNSH